MRPESARHHHAPANPVSVTNSLRFKNPRHRAHDHNHGAVHPGPEIEESPDAGEGGSGRPQSPDLGRPHGRDHRLRVQARASGWIRIERTSWSPTLPSEHQDHPSQVPTLCGVETGSAREPTSGNANHSNRLCTRGHGQFNAQGQGHRQGQAKGLGHMSVAPQHEGRMGYGTRPVSLPDYDLKLGDSASPCATREDAEPGECSDACSAPS